MSTEAAAHLLRSFINVRGAPWYISYVVGQQAQQTYIPQSRIQAQLLGRSHPSSFLSYEGRGYYSS